MLIRHHFHGCKAQLAHASHVKWRYTKYLALTFFNLLNMLLMGYSRLILMSAILDFWLNKCHM